MMTITLTLGGIKFPVTIENDSQEELYRKAEKQLNEVIAKYRKSYPGRSADFIHLFAAFELVIDKIKLEQQIENDSENVMKRIKNLSDQLDNI